MREPVIYVSQDKGGAMASSRLDGYRTRDCGVKEYLISHAVG